eukprot:7610721-Pyramimonas_sp.AAC.2
MFRGLPSRLLLFPLTTSTLGRKGTHQAYIELNSVSIATTVSPSQSPSQNRAPGLASSGYPWATRREENC